MSSLKPGPSEAALCDDYLAAKRNAAEAKGMEDWHIANSARQVLERRVIELIRYRKSVIQHGVYRFVVEHDELVVIKVPKPQPFRR